VLLCHLHLHLLAGLHSKTTIIRMSLYIKYFASRLGDSLIYGDFDTRCWKSDVTFFTLYQPPDDLFRIQIAKVSIKLTSKTEEASF